MGHIGETILNSLGIVVTRVKRFREQTKVVPRDFASLVAPFTYLRRHFMSEFFVPRGTQDIFGKEIKKWHHVESIIRDLCERFNVEEMRTPMYEHTEVFARKGDASDVVNKEMYTFTIKRGEGESPSLTLKPEGTAGLIRSYVTNKLYASGPSFQKYFYIAPNFRYERPQKGRMRIHHQFGVEFLGQESPFVDVEALTLGLDVLESLNVTQYKVLINTLGDRESQDAYQKALKDHFKDDVSSMCVDCQRRYEQNPLRMLDCKVDQEHPALISAPSNEASLNDASKEYFASVLKVLDAANVPYEVDARLVRGLDYYNHTVFEVVSTDPNVGSNSTLFAGGRYNHLVEYYGGPSVSAFGFGMGIERLLLMVDEDQFDLDAHIDLYGMAMGEEALPSVFNVINKLRKSGYSAEMDLENRSMKAKYKMSDRLNAKVILICGEEELAKNTVSLKNQATREQVEVAVEDIEKQLESWKL